MTARAEGIDPILERLFDASIELDARQARLAQLRQEQPELSARIDRAVLQRDRLQAEAIRRLDAVNGELREMAERLTGAPLNEGVFVGPCTLPDGRTLARVAGNG
ncbi:MAG: hypothetical protein IT514_01540, partial [Burkholderiales bacterium]|nr:hypothetical protein [Burkholderiales bacterium]